jgi:hypothetical protein
MGRLLSLWAKKYPWVSDVVISERMIPLRSYWAGFQQLVTPDQANLRAAIYNVSQTSRFFYESWIKNQKYLVPKPLKPYYEGLEKSRDAIAKALYKKVREADSAADLYYNLKIMKEAGIPYFDLKHAFIPNDLSRMIAKQFSHVLNVEFLLPPHLLKKGDVPVINQQLGKWEKEVNNVVNFVGTIASDFGIKKSDLLKELAINVKLPKFNSNTELKAFVRSVDDFVNDNFQLKSAFNVNMEQLKKIYDSMSDTVKLFAKDITFSEKDSVYCNPISISHSSKLFSTTKTSEIAFLFSAK